LFNEDISYNFNPNLQIYDLREKTCLFIKNHFDNYNYYLILINKYEKPVSLIKRYKKVWKDKILDENSFLLHEEREFETSNDIIYVGVAKLINNNYENLLNQANPLNSFIIGYNKKCRNDIFNLVNDLKLYKNKKKKYMSYNYDTICRYISETNAILIFYQWADTESAYHIFYRNDNLIHLAVDEIVML
jgi:hypothetical protein